MGDLSECFDSMCLFVEFYVAVFTDGHSFFRRHVLTPLPLHFDKLAVAFACNRCGRFEAFSQKRRTIQGLLFVAFRLLDFCQQGLHGFEERRPVGKYLAIAGSRSFIPEAMPGFVSKAGNLNPGRTRYDRHDSSKYHGTPASERVCRRR